MSDFYITLPSHSSKNEFPNNTSNNFKIRLPHPIRLEGGGWKVGLVAVSLPDPTSQVPPLMKDENVFMFETYWIADNTTIVQGKKVFRASFQPKDLRREDLETLDGKGFMNSMKAFFDKKKVEAVLSSGWKIADADGKNRTAVCFEWEGDDLVIHNQDVKMEKWTDNSYYPAFFVNADLAVNMGWFIDKGNNKYVLGPNLTIEVPNGIIPTPIDTIIASTPGDEFWKYTSGMLRLTLKCNWRFINLNASFKNVLGSTKRSLFIYSDVSGSSVVGNQVTDLLREVNYNREGKGSQYFEPLHIQYIPVRKDTVDIIETQVAETTGELTSFGPGNTIITLHFKKT